MEELPEEIWTLILSYNILPYCNRVCKYLYIIERSLYNYRTDIVISNYDRCAISAIDNEDIDSFIFMLSNTKDMNIDIISGSKHYIPYLIECKYNHILNDIIGNIPLIIMQNILKKAIKKDNRIVVSWLHNNNDYYITLSLIYYYSNIHNRYESLHHILTDSEKLDDILKYALIRENTILFKYLMSRYNIDHTRILSITNDYSYAIYKKMINESRNNKCCSIS